MKGWVRHRAWSVWLPLLAVAAAAGWLMVPSESRAAAAGTSTTTSTTTGASPAVPPVSTGTPPVPTPAIAPPTSLPSQSPPGGPVGARGVPASVLYQQDCAACHGSNGRGTSRGVSLSGVGEAAVDFQLSTGRMPKRDSPSRPEPYRPILPQQDIQALDQYVTALVAHGGPGIPSVDPSAGDEASGGELFREDCAACHGWGGAGGILYNRPVPAITEATPTQLGEAVRTGPAAMPKFGPKEISSSEVNDLAAYLESLKHPYDKGGNPISHLGPVAEGAVVWLVAMVGLLFVMRWIGKRG